MYVAEVSFYGRITDRSVRNYVPIFRYLRSRRRVGGVLVTINSEGGDATASQILYDALSSLSSKKTVYAFIQGLGVSGSYWLACACTKIYAMETSLVGSIGVISVNPPSVRRFLERIGIDVNVTKVGKYKDMLSPFSPPADDEAREIYRKVLSDIFSRFRDDVISRRKIPPERIDETINGRVFSPREALELGS
ncbi:S49 family peptidase [Thermogymnomonas acidicola]|uniref:S49 family peptidase n=1 Tax=Thermogymnomonas acidicola TaxID=399579 RepID=UPI0009461FB0|nr:S49 family peptidase [Thermogymnomonas acidicola]